MIIEDLNSDHIKALNLFREALGQPAFDDELFYNHATTLYNAVTTLPAVLPELQGANWNAEEGLGGDPRAVSPGVPVGQIFFEKTGEAGRPREALRFELHEAGTTSVKLIVQLRLNNGGWRSYGPLTDWDDVNEANHSEKLVDFIASVLPDYSAEHDARRA